ncbi:unnamed protein product [Urochloa humidicola]
MPPAPPSTAAAAAQQLESLLRRLATLSHYKQFNILLSIIIAELYQMDSVERFMRSMVIKWLLYLTFVRRRRLMVTKMKRTKCKMLNQQFTGLTLRISSTTMILRRKIGIFQLKH